MQVPCRTHRLLAHSSSEYSLYMNILQHCVDTRTITPGLLVHNRVLTNGFYSNVHLNTKLVIFYAKFGRVPAARSIFDRMEEKSVVSWTAMVSGYTQNGCFRDALMVFLEMCRAGVKPNQFGYGSTLRACTGLRCLETGFQIQGCIQKSRFIVNLFVQSALIDFHSKCGKMDDACYVFERMSKRDLVSWNAIIGGYAVQGYSDDSFRVFCSLMREGEHPDCFTLGSLLRALAGGSFIMKVSQVHALIIQLGYGSYNSLSGSLINAYVKCGSIENSYQIYMSMSEKDIISCTALISGYAQESNHGRDALDVLKEMTRMHLVFDEVALCCMLNMCANVASLSLGRQLHALTFKHQFYNDVAMGNALIDMYAKTGEIEEATRAFDEMEEKNIISWTSLIAGYGKHGFGHKAIELYKKMECEGLKPNDVTFLSLLCACSHTGLTSEGWECFKDMVSKHSILPREEHIACLVDIFARGGWLEEAFHLICKMNVKPNASLWGSILGACSTYGNMCLGEVAAKHLFHVDPDNSANYAVLASLYSATGAWDNAGNMRNFMKNRSLKKEPGHSFLQSTQNKLILL
ncbi:pentatricopeptide repeat-containing protein At3g20730 [Humulus lupulus]|uniref:pentatricopeptide repeat-containing protein At3g20730 n=1 Tax=Humulus lupulus TaxID=3486 RepID=UPI002B40F6AD|nr:pentatricopeptide repeat-containing protein At3g20730 [Humulus lupulus]XP_062092096.1 pentatricopeptide repeat-containing protein At3g20730 [Humulus lupulus]